jgi:hypothetical protein
MQFYLLGWAIFDCIQVNQAIAFLHDLGTVQHFSSELLQDRVIINPQWIVDVMACLVSVQNTVIKVSLRFQSVVLDLVFFFICNFPLFGNGVREKY